MPFHIVVVCCSQANAIMNLVVALEIALARPDDDLTNMVVAPEVAAASSTPTPVTTNAISLPFLLLSLPPLPCRSI